FVAYSVSAVQEPRKGDAMDTARIRVKIGVHEFDAEGPAAQVADQFESWKALISAVPTTNNSNQAAAIPANENVLAGMKTALDAIQQDRLAPLFQCDDKRDVVTLRSLPIGEDRHREAVLLVLYGFLRLRNVDEVIVTKLKTALETSGSAPDRIDRV